MALPGFASIRLPDDLRSVAFLHGDGNVSEGVRRLIDRHDRLMKAALPTLSADEAGCLYAALQSRYPTWAEDVRMVTGNHLATEIRDFRPTNAGNVLFERLDWDGLEARMRALDPVECLSIAYAVEAMSADPGQPTDKGVSDVARRHFRIVD